ncbi:MAG: hypothetical protein CL685_02035 [Candidatus Magasanikbacteria bacterium]|nr:hypothetical protein [Candidatus Magasanikbacteria bacterium]|tara:strand:- start:526 stop:1635 length:1110 start_codon:yes stop_codon:yes gene_type:complete
MKKRMLILSSCLFAVCLFLTGCMHTTKEGVSNSDKSVKIGVLLPLSGGASSYGEEMMMVLKHKNAMLKNPAELHFEDSKCTASDAVSGFQKLVDLKSVDAILGGFCSSETLAIEPLLEQNNLVAISGTSSSPEIEGKSQNMMTLSYSDNVIAEAMAKHLAGSKNIAIITEQNDYNIALKNSLENLLGDKIIANEVFEKDAKDMRNIIEKVKQSSPDVLILNPNIGDTTTTLITQLAESKDYFKNIKLVSQETYVADSSRVGVEDLVEGMVLFAAPTLSDSRVDSFIASLPSSVDNLGVFYSATAHDALENLVRAVQDSRLNNTLVLDELRNGPLSGLVVKGKDFAGKNFVQGIEAGKFVVTKGKAVSQK